MTLTPPTPALPPLNALRALEAAVRHGSFQRAAAELSVSAGAVAQQIRNLEAWCGVELFERHPQGVSPTALALQLLPDLSSGFEILGQVARDLRQSSDVKPIRIAALPAIAQLWIGPRLSALHKRLPEYELSIHALDQLPELIHGTFDLAIYTLPPTPELSVLCENNMVPVAAPALAKTLKAVTDLGLVTRLHDSAWGKDWGTWLRAQGLSGVNAERGPTFSLYRLAVERCIAGDGVLIGHTGLIAHHLKAGRLMAPFPDLKIPSLPICLKTPRNQRDGKITDIISALVDLSEANL